MSRAHAPGRVNLIGEHTDYTGGFVLPMAVDMGVTCEATPRADRLVTAWSREMSGAPMAADLDSLAPGAVTGWAAYVLGTIWALGEAGVVVPPCDIRIESTLPAGAGLSSSAAVECAVALAVLDLAGVGMQARDIARIAKRAENDFVGAPTGSMDQVASMLAQPDALLFFDTGLDITRTVPFPLRANGLHLLVMDTHAHHQLVTDEYGERRRALEAATVALAVPSLRDVQDARSVESLTDDTLRRRARHVVTENARVQHVIELLTAGEVAAVGPVLSAGHASLRDDLEVSCDELDVAVDAAVNAGALGARMVGGGFGGSAIALVRATHVDVVRSAVAGAYRARNWREPDVYDVVPAPGARLLA
ncbi:MAG: galactokinase [Candidatus Nanopelagicales bacterium]